MIVTSYQHVQLNNLWTSIINTDGGAWQRTDGAIKAYYDDAVTQNPATAHDVTMAYIVDDLVSQLGSSITGLVEVVTFEHSTGYPDMVIHVGVQVA